MKLFLNVLCVFLIGISSGFSQNKKTIVKEITINFDSGSSMISSDNLEKIDAVLKELTADKTTYSVEISAYTDSQGSIDFNNKLSAKRAIASADIFVKNGFLFRKIGFKANGEFEPIADNDSETGRAQNRRVAVKICQNSNDQLAVGGFTIQEKTYAINTATPQKITYDSGTIITIPENAFVDKNGQPVTGEVQLNYIEYRDAVDFILGNIPMNHHLDGEDFQFNSAGMFKVGASKEGEEVFLGKDKNLDLDFKLTEKLPDLNFYKFDEQNNIWVELKKGLTANEKDTLKFDDFLVQKKEINLDTIKRKVDGPAFYGSQNESNSFSCGDFHRFLNLGKVMASGPDSLYVKITMVPKKLKPTNLKRQKTAQYQLTNAQRAKKVFQDQKNGYVVKCDIVKENSAININVVSNSYIKKLSDIKWISKEEVKNDNSKSLSVFDIEKKEQNLYTITLKDSLDEKVLTNLKVEHFDKQKGQILDNIINQLKNRQVQLKRLDNLIANQNQTIDKKKNLISYYKKVRYSTSDTIARYSRLIEYFWKFNSVYMTPEEKAMSENDWVKFFDSNKPLMLKRYQGLQTGKENEYCYKLEEERRLLQEKRNKLANVDGNVRQKLQISTLGIYNCDQIQRLFEPIIVDAEYFDDKGNSITPVYIYIVDKRINGILRYDANGNFRPSHFAFSPSSKNVLLAFDIDGNAYVYTTQKMKNIDTTKQFQKFVVDKIENISDKGQLTSLLD